MIKQFLKFVSVFVIIGAIQGCASVGSAVQNAIVYASQAIDDSVAKAISNQSGQVSLRSNSLVNRPSTLNALKLACQQGRYVEIFLYQANTSTGAEFKHTCVTVYVSANTNLARQEVLLQGFQLYTSGQPVSVSRYDFDQEVAFRNFLRTSSYRVN